MKPQGRLFFNLWLLFYHMNLELITMSYAAELRQKMKIKEHVRDAIVFNSGMFSGFANTAKIMGLMSESSLNALADIVKRFRKEVSDAGYSIKGKDVGEASKALFIFTAIKGTDYVFHNDFSFMRIDDGNKEIFLDKDELRTMLSDWVQDATGIPIDGFLSMIDKFKGGAKPDPKMLN